MALSIRNKKAESLERRLSAECGRTITHVMYGKGKHAAALNMGDCCSYALSRFSDEPLLFKGDDFNKTDLKSLSF